MLPTPKQKKDIRARMRTNIIKGNDRFIRKSASPIGFGSSSGRFQTPLLARRKARRKANNKQNKASNPKTGPVTPRQNARNVENQEEGLVGSAPTPSPEQTNTPLRLNIYDELFSPAATPLPTPSSFRPSPFPTDLTSIRGGVKKRKTKRRKRKGKKKRKTRRRKRKTKRRGKRKRRKSRRRR
jgi:hypothetical protein